MLLVSTNRVPERVEEMFRFVICGRIVITVTFSQVPWQCLYMMGSTVQDAADAMCVNVQSASESVEDVQVCNML